MYEVRLNATPKCVRFDRVELTHCGAIHCFNLEPNAEYEHAPDQAVGEIWYHESTWTYVRKVK